MSTVLFKQKLEREVAQEGLTRAAICAVFDIGVQEGKNYNDGKQPKRQKQFVFLFELDEKRSDGKPFIISNRYNASLDERASLYKLISKLRGKPTAEQLESGIDLQSFIGTNCFVNVVHYNRKDGTVGAKIDPVPMPLKKEDLVRLKIQYDGVVPKWIQDVAASAIVPPDWVAGVKASTGSVGVVEDDLAF